MERQPDRNALTHTHTDMHVHSYPTSSLALVLKWSVLEELALISKWRTVIVAWGPQGLLSLQISEQQKDVDHLFSGSILVAFQSLRCAVLAQSTQLFWLEAL